MAELRAYGALLAAQFRSVATYRVSFVVELVTNIGSTAFDVLTVLVLFRATKVVAGFTLPEATLMVGLTACAFSIGDLLVGNIDDLKEYVRTGRLDAVLVRPLSVLVQLLVMDLPLRKGFRVLFGTVVYLVALHINHLDWTPSRLVLAVVAPAAAAAFFGAIFVLSASLAFWWVDSGEIGAAFTYGGRDFTSYPIGAYGRWFRTFLAYGLGFGFVSYQPALALLDKRDPLGLPAWTGYVSPLVALVAAGIAAVVWRIGIRHYRSTGS